MAAQGTCRSWGPLQCRDSEFRGCPATQGTRPASWGLAPAHLETLDLGTFEVQHETLAQAWVWGPRRCLELQREIGPGGEEAATRLRSPKLGQDSGAGTVPVEQCQHVPFAHIQAAGSRTRYGGWTTIRFIWPFLSFGQLWASLR